MAGECGPQPNTKTLITVDRGSLCVPLLQDILQSLDFLIWAAERKAIWNALPPQSCGALLPGGPVRPPTWLSWSQRVRHRMNFRAQVLLALYHHLSSAPAVAAATEGADSPPAPAARLARCHAAGYTSQYDSLRCLCHLAWRLPLASSPQARHAQVVRATPRT